MGLLFRNSLREDIVGEIQRDHSDIAPHYFSRWKEFKHYLFSREEYRIVVPLVIVLLVVLSFRMPFLDFIEFKDGTANANL